MKINKTLVAALILTLGLASCDNMVKNENEQAPVVEEPATEGENAPEVTAPAETGETTENPEDAEGADDMTVTDPLAEGTEEDPTATEGAEAETTEVEGEEDTQRADSSLATDDASAKSMLEQAIFDNRTQARAIEILLDLNPVTIQDIKPELESLLAESNDLLARAQEALDQLNN